jgi:hypothetical protein
VYGRASRAVVVEARGAEFDRLVISRKDAEDIAERIRRSLP